MEEKNENTAENTAFLEKLAATEKRAAELEAAVACLSRGVSPESTADVISLAAAVGECESIDETVGRVVEKYPFFKAQKAAKPFEKLTTGIHFAPVESAAPDGVEEAFLRANPGVKL